MKFELGTKFRRVSGRFYKDALPAIFVGIEDGVYKVQFDSQTKKVEFSKEKDNLHNCELMYVSAQFGKNDLMPKDGFDAVLSFPCGELFFYDNGKKYQLIMEFLDTSFEEIETHSHPENVTEVYLDVGAPYRGEVCGFGEAHKPFDKHTLAVKLIKIS